MFYKVLITEQEQIIEKLLPENSVFFKFDFSKDYDLNVSSKVLFFREVTSDMTSSLLLNLYESIQNGNEQNISVIYTDNDTLENQMVDNLKIKRVFIDYNKDHDDGGGRFNPNAVKLEEGEIVLILSFVVE